MGTRGRDFIVPLILSLSDIWTLLYKSTQYGEFWRVIWDIQYIIERIGVNSLLSDTNLTGFSVTIIYSPSIIISGCTHE